MNDYTEKKRDWGMFFIGVVLVICSIVILAWPGITLVTIALMAGFMFLFAGGADAAAFFTAKGVSGRGWILLNAILDLILGFMFLVHPVVAADVLPWLAGGFIIGYGICAMIAAFGVRKIGSTWWLTLINGILAIIIGILFFVDPVNFVIFLSVFLMWRGVLMCVYGLISPRSLQ